MCNVRGNDPNFLLIIRMYCQHVPSVTCVPACSVGGGGCSLRYVSNPPQVRNARLCVAGIRVQGTCLGQLFGRRRNAGIQSRSLVGRKRLGAHQKCNERDAIAMLRLTTLQRLTNAPCMVLYRTRRDTVVQRSTYDRTPTTNRRCAQDRLWRCGIANMVRNRPNVNRP